MTLNRPQVKNAAGTATWPGLQEALRRTADEQVRAVVLTGAGGAFCAGGDLKDPGPDGAGVMAATTRLSWVHQVLEAIHRLPTPTIAAVEGPAVGIGWGLALVCDLVVVAAEGASFSAPFLDRGLVPDGGVAWHLSRILGPKRAADILLDGRRLDVAEAEELGLVTQVVAEGHALDAALGVAEATTRRPADAVALTRRLLRLVATCDLPGFLESEQHAVVLNSHGPAPAEGRAAFRESRPPRFVSTPQAAEEQRS